MEKNEIYEKLKEIIKQGEFMSVKFDISRITMNTSLINELVLDSIQILELIICIEKGFDIVCDAYELNLDMFNRVEDLVKFIEKKINIGTN